MFILASKMTEVILLNEIKMVDSCIFKGIVEKI